MKRSGALESGRVREAELQTQCTAFLRELRSRVEGPLVCEPRHATWFTPEIEALLDELRIARVAADPAPVEGAAEPAHPAPVLDVLPAKGSEKAAAVAATPDKADSKDSMARGMGIGAGIVALGGIGLGLRRKR